MSINTRQTENTALPSDTVVDKLDPKYFFFDLPLYEPVKLENNELIKKASTIIYYGGEFNAYNYSLKENSTFEGYNNTRYSNDKLLPVNSINNITLRCKRTEEVFNFYVYVGEEDVQKIGQFPSVADLNIGQIAKYDKVLSKEKLKEFTRAIGLKANGVGIGSFVYLRRIFEHLIEQEHLEAKKSNTWDEASFLKSRMNEKIQMLEEYLPVFLIENKELYGILSLGIHQLNEQQCLSYFDGVRMGIEEILEEKIIVQQRRDRKNMAQQKIKQITQAITKKDQA